MSVHKEISAHSKKQHELVRAFASLEARREQAIEADCASLQRRKPFSVDGINAVTTEINELSQKYTIIPGRKIVTEEMVKEYVARI